MSFVVNPNNKQVRFIGTGTNHPLTGKLGEAAIWADCHKIVFASQMVDTVNPFDLTSRKRVQSFTLFAL